MRPQLRPPRLIGFGLAGSFAAIETWSLPEFCWSTWLAGLVFTWACALSGALQIVLTASTLGKQLRTHAGPLQRISPRLLATLVALFAILALLAAGYAYAFIFGLYGLLLSVFAEMQPHNLFGRNGFINSDFWTPVSYLLASYWAMTLATLIANWRSLLRTDPIKRMVLPFSGELIRVHVMVVAVPFLALAAWAVVGDAYHIIVILVLMGLFFLWPRNRDVDAVKLDAGRGGRLMMVTMLAGTATLSGCYRWADAGPNPQIALDSAAVQPRALRVTLVDGTRVEFHKPVVRRDSIIQRAQAGLSPRSVPRESVVKLETHRFSAGKTALAVALSVAAYPLLYALYFGTCGCYDQ